MRRVLLLAIFFLAACTDDGLTVRLDIRSDLIAEVDFDEASISIDGLGEQRLAASGNQQWLEPIRVARFDAVPEGTYDGYARLSLDGDEVIGRALRIRVAADLVSTITLSRVCLEVSCDESSVCFNGECVDPACLQSQDPECAAAACVSPAECDAGASCERPDCVGGTCIFESVCDDGYCSPAANMCVPVDAPDAGMDASDLDADPGDAEVDACEPICLENSCGADGCGGECRCGAESSFCFDERCYEPDPCTESIGAPCTEVGTEQLLPASAERFDQVGSSVAISAAGDVIAIGARTEAGGVPGDPSDNSAGGAGAVFVYRRVDGVWREDAYLKAATTSAEDRFGFKVDLSDDGNVLLVTARWDDDPEDAGVAVDESGSAFVFRYDGTVWQEEAMLKEETPTVSAWYGHAAAISGDGTRVAIGTILTRGVSGRNNSGSVSLYRYEAGDWIRETVLGASNAGGTDQFGRSVALDFDGTHLAVGAQQEDGSIGGVNPPDDNALSDSGAAYVFERTGTEWVEAAILKAASPREGARLGEFITISGDGQRIAVGAAGNPDAPQLGEVSIFANSAGSWNLDATLVRSNAEEADGFGNNLSFAPDASRLLVGCIGDDSAEVGVGASLEGAGASNSGAVLLFERSEDAWEEVLRIKDFESLEGREFGRSVALSNEGVLVGCSMQARDRGAATGSCSVFMLPPASVD